MSEEQLKYDFENRELKIRCDTLEQRAAVIDWALGFLPDDTGTDYADDSYSTEEYPWFGYDDSDGESDISVWPPDNTGISFEEWFSIVSGEAAAEAETFTSMEGLL